MQTDASHSAGPGTFFYQLWFRSTPLTFCNPAGSRPVGVVEQLASGDPTVLCMTLTQGPPPVTVRLTLEEDEAMKVAAFERAIAEGWVTRGRR